MVAVIAVPERAGDSRENLYRADEITARGKDAIRNDVQAEKQRLLGKKAGKATDTNLAGRCHARTMD
jgi:hypothetical protein